MLTDKRVCIANILPNIRSGRWLIFRTFVNEGNSRKNGTHSFKSFKN